MTAIYKCQTLYNGDVENAELVRVDLYNQIPDAGEERTMKGYTTHGNIRGQCGHLHKTPGAAEKCQARDSAGCRRQGGYSDRYIAIVYDDGLLQKYDADYPMGEQEPRYFHSADGQPAIFAARRGR